MRRILLVASGSASEKAWLAWLVEARHLNKPDNQSLLKNKSAVSSKSSIPSTKSQPQQVLAMTKAHSTVGPSL